MRKIKKTKAQVRMGETISVLVIFFFIVFFGFSFYAKIQQNQIIDQQREHEQLLAIQHAQKAYYLPELQCSRGYELTRESCWDTKKVEKLKEMIDPSLTSAKSIEAQQTYFDVFGYGKIGLDQIFPDSSAIPFFSDDPYILYENELVETGDVPVSIKATQMPIALYDPIEKKYAFAILNVEYMHK